MYGSGGATFVAMMKSAYLGTRDNSALVRHLNGPRVWAVHIERQMRSGSIVIRDVLGADSPEVIFAEDDDMVQTLSPYTAVESFRIRILPGTMRRREDLSFLKIRTARPGKIGEQNPTMVDGLKSGIDS